MPDPPCALHEAGASVSEIARETGPNWRTVKKYLPAPSTTSAAGVPSSASGGGWNERDFREYGFVYGTAADRPRWLEESSRRGHDFVIECLDADLEQHASPAPQS